MTFVTMNTFSNPAVLTNDTVIGTWSDSFGRGAFGQRQILYLASYYICYYPQYMVPYRDHSRSGDNNGGILQIRMPAMGIPDMITCNGITNGLNIFYVSGNGGFDSNSIYGLFQAGYWSYPSNSYNTTNVAYTDHGVLTNDWTQSHPENRYDSFVIGDVIYPNLSNASSNYSAGAAISALVNGKLFVNTVANMLSLVTTYNGDKNILWFPNGAAFDHPNNVFQFLWAMKTLTNPTNSFLGIGADTNTFKVVINGNTLTATTTDHCTVSSLTGVTTNFIFTFHADRMAPGFYVPNAAGQTNDCRPAFTLDSTVGNSFHEDWVITGLPIGIYEVAYDGYTNQITSAQFAVGYNWFTNFNNPQWTQKTLLLSNMCETLQFNPLTVSDQINIGNNQLNVNFESVAATVWATNAPGVDAYAARLQSGFALETALFGMDKTNHTIVQQVDHPVGIKLVVPGSGYVAAPYR